MAEQSKKFWGNIWSQSADHKKDLNWLQGFEKKLMSTTGEDRYYHRKF